MSIQIEVRVTKSDYKAGLIKLKADLMDSAKKAVRETTDIFYKKVFDNISMPMHGSFPEQHYRALGKFYDFPFAERHGGILPHGHEPTWSVHRVYGMMRRELTKEVSSGINQELGRIGWIHGYSPEVTWVLEGTSLMLARPVLHLTAEQINLTQLLEDEFIKYYKA